MVDREKEIDAFIPVEYWNLGALLKTDQSERNFRANLYSVDGKRFEKEAGAGKEVTLIDHKEAADAILARMQSWAFRSSQSRTEREKAQSGSPVHHFNLATGS